MQHNTAATLLGQSVQDHLTGMEQVAVLPPVADSHDVLGLRVQRAGQIAFGILPRRIPKAASIRPTVVSLTRTPVMSVSWRASNFCVQVGRAQP